MEPENTLIASTLLAAIIAALILALSHDRLPKSWPVTGNYAFGSTVCLLALSTVIAINGIGWQWIVVAWLMWTVPGMVVVALHVQDETERDARRKKRDIEDEQSKIALD